MPIRKLPPLLINQIAAGEVIERPASVVKELLENSLDAGATRIDVAIEDGGARLIRVADDGEGVPPGELPLAVAAHATSKLTSADELGAIRSLGFRGEALASVASVSRLRITSRARRDGRLAEAAAVLTASGDALEPPQPTAGAPGTVVEVRDLFFNTPARRRFLRAASTEFGHISETVLRVAMVHPKVGFTLTHNGRETLAVPPEQDRAERCVALLGQDLAEGLLELEHADPPEAGGARVWGLAGVPSIARASAKFQYLCVNGRPVRDRSLSHAVKEAYRGLMPPDRHPVAVVMIELDPAQVDVNVHPAKAEVRFREPSRVHGLVLSAIRQRLLASDLTPSAAPGPAGYARPEGGDGQAPGMIGLGPDWLSGSGSAPLHGSAGADPRGFTPPPGDDDGGTSGGGSRGGEVVVPGNPNAFVDYFRRMDPTQKGFVYQEVRRAMAEADPEAAGATDAGSEEPAPPASAGPRILQVHDSYLVTQDDHGLLIVDQHALHERVMFEQLSRRVLGEGRPLQSQRLLMPAVVDAGPSRQAAAETLGPLLERIGIELSPLGPGSLGVQAFPVFLFERRVDAARFVSDLLDRAEAGDIDASDATAIEAALHTVLDMMACKAAVKAGDAMSPAELTALLAQREQVERSSNCPHGRPTSIRLTLRDLEKHFKRG